MKQSLHVNVAYPLAVPVMGMLLILSQVKRQAN
jgi:hypothetical protein